MLVCIYCRVSSDEQAEKDNSIPAQRKALVRWAAQHGMTIVRDFADEGESAYAPANKRPGFMEMMAFCRKKGAQLILVHKLDRFSRNREESILFKGMLRKAGVAVKSISEDFDPETPQGFLYEGMIEVINQFYSMNLATETIKGMRENAERGYHNGGQTPYGYRLEKIEEKGRTRGRLVEGPENEIKTVRDIFRMAGEEGYGARSIASELNRQGIPAPRSKHWGKETIGAILANPVYVGDLAWRRRKAVGRSQRKATERSEWIVSPDAVPALVDRQLFEKRKALAESRPFSGKPSRDGHGKYLLSRLIRCGNCGNNFVGKHQTYKTRQGEPRIRRHYTCSGYLVKGASVCPSNVIPVEWADDSVVDLLGSSICSPARFAELEARVKQRLEARHREASLDSKTFTRKIQDVERRIANFYRAIGEGMDTTICRQHIVELTARKAELEQEAELVEQEDYHARALSGCVDSMRQFATTFQSGFESLPLGIRRQVVRYFVSRIEVIERDTFRVVLRIPFDDRGLKLLTDEMEHGHSEKDSLDAADVSGGTLDSYPFVVAGGANRDSPQTIGMVFGVGKGGMFVPGVASRAPTMVYPS